MAITNFPNDAVCFILVDIPGEGEFQGSGAIIGPHTILTAAHLVYDADTDVTADQVSIYPGFEPNGTAYNPAGALPGYQSIHTVKVPDYDEELSAEATQRDFAVINTSADLTAYGSFALDPAFVSGDAVVNGYPASGGGYQGGIEGVVSRDGSLSDIGTSGLALAPGYSGGPLWHDVERNGNTVPAVIGTVSTNDDAMKLTRPKVGLIRHWIAADQSLYDGGQDAPRGLVPQIPGTVSSSVDAASVSPPGHAATLAAAIISGPAEPAPSRAGHAGDLEGPVQRAHWNDPHGHHGSFGAGHGAAPSFFGHHAVLG